MDVDQASRALQLIETIGPRVEWYKVGLELYAAAGMEFVRQIGISFGKKVFLDLKLYDIGETVRRATTVICRDDVSFLTVHARLKVMRAALDVRGEAKTKILGVTVLTDLEQTDLPACVKLADLVDSRTRQAVQCGVDGLVCSALEVSRVRELAGPNMILVTPGVRSAGTASGDQRRIATPREAIRGGADYIVVGRQVTRAPDPAAACDRILDEIA